MRIGRREHIWAMFYIVHHRRACWGCCSWPGTDGVPKCVHIENCLVSVTTIVDRDQNREGKLMSQFVRTINWTVNQGTNWTINTPSVPTKNARQEHFSLLPKVSTHPPRLKIHKPLQTFSKTRKKGNNVRKKQLITKHCKHTLRDKSTVRALEKLH